MATGKNKEPWFFNFLKEGFLLPNRNLRLFTAVCALMLVSTTLLDLSRDLAVKPLADEIMVDAKALNATDPGSPDQARVQQEVQNDTKEFLLVGAGYLLFAFVVGSAVRIVVIFAAVSTYYGEERTTTFGALLGKAGAQIKGPLLTLAYVYVLEIFYIVLLTIVSSILAILMVKQYFVTLLVESLSVFFSFLCSFSVVVAVAEPGCHGAGALDKAWRLVKGKKTQVVLYLALNSALASPVRTLARTCSGYSLALGLLPGFVCAVQPVLLALLQLFEVCAMTALYYERREDSGSRLGATGYEKLSTEEANA